MTPEKQQKIDTLLIPAARFTGSASLFLFGLFLFFGARSVIDIRLSEVNVMRWNAMLSVLFFIQHSSMVRRSLNARLINYLPGHYHGALYTIISGAVLTAVVVLWQPSNTLLLELQGVSRWIARGIFILGAAGFTWGVRALQSFDAYGDARIKAHLRGIEPEAQIFSVSGPYLWVRHPLYFFTLLLIWSCPDLTVDRLLFNVLWTAWIYIGTLLEEKDLRAVFGDKYQCYQQKVPMLIPWKGLVNIPTL